MSNNTQPEIRFPGFTDDWEERKLKELFQPSKNKNNNGLYNQKDILAASLGTELIPKRTFFGLKSTRESVKNYRIVKTGDLIYTKSPIKGFPNGIIRSNKGNVGIVPPLYCVYTLQKDINSSIIQLYFEDKNRLNFYLFPLVNVGARNNVNITDLEFLEGKVTIPKSYEEQSKIVQFMEQLNTTIALHQRKLDLLKETKKGFLQKMFPKNGAKVPEIRFPGFTEDWEERKLGDITKISTGKLDANAMVENGKYDFYTSGIKKYRIDVAAFEGPSITIAGNGATVGYMHLADNKFNAYQRTYVLQEFLVDRSFIFSEIGNKLPKKIKQEARTGNIPYIVMDMLTELKLSIPQNNSEQQKIGSFFKQLDDTIALHQRKLDLLKETKKGFLQKMFV
ncbi:restriction endonuclease subunit S [Enterococcus faecalis]|uniref:restriction endonuclease subunit S n=1 Tax=Enterococcus faecalis TaxID=1351 RepID=UPI0022E4C3AD|nr:restriction endonuclease subunit S [Enterococcus faecalis]